MFFVDNNKPANTDEIISGQSYGKSFSPNGLMCSILDTLLLRIAPLLDIVGKHQEKIFVQHQ